MAPVSSHGLGVFVDAFCALLLIRTATGRDNSRFLFHFAAAWALLSLDRLVLLIGTLLTLSGLIPKEQHATLGQIDALISISANLFLLLGAYLLFEYPLQRIPALPAQWGVFALGFFALLVTLGNLSQSAFQLVEIIDIVTSTVCVLFLGIALTRQWLKGGMSRTTEVFILAAIFFVFSNAGLQPFWDFAEKYPDYFFWYHPTLTASSLLAVISIVLFSIRFLPQKVEQGELDRSLQAPSGDVNSVLQQIDACRTALDQLRTELKRSAPEHG